MTNTTQEITDFITANRESFWRKYNDDVVFTEMRDGKMASYHIVTLDSYNAIRSHHYFRKRETDKFSSGKPLTFYYISDPRSTHEMDINIHRIMGTDIIGDTPTYQHATIFDFYKAIGYDYKKKKYI